MSGLDDKSIQNLVKKMQKQAKPRNLEAKTYDATAPQRVSDGKDQEAEKIFKEMTIRNLNTTKKLYELMKKVDETEPRGA